MPRGQGRITTSSDLGSNQEGHPRLDERQVSEEKEEALPNQVQGAKVEVS